MNFKRIAIISVTLNAILTIGWIGKRMYFSRERSPDIYEKWNAARKNLLDMLPIDSSDVVFVGNSITEGFPLQEMFGTIHVKNRGIGGNQSRHIMGRIKEVAEGHPKKIFFDIGINDLIYHVPIDSVLVNYGRIVDIVRASSPRTEILVHSVFPVGPANINIVDSIPALNSRLQVLCRARGLTYIDLYPELLSGRFIAPAYTVDDVHLTGAGYAIWKKKVQPLL